MAILKSLEDRYRLGKKSIAVLVDPDKVENSSELDPLIRLANENCVDFFFVGGSLVTTTNMGEVIRHIKENVSIPVVIFPGSSLQVDRKSVV